MVWKQLGTTYLHAAYVKAILDGGRGRRQRACWFKACAACSPERGSELSSPCAGPVGLEGGWVAEPHPSAPIFAGPLPSVPIMVGGSRPTAPTAEGDAGPHAAGVF